MKRFAFRLERLLQLRERAERTQAAELGAAMREEEARRQTLEQAEAALARATEQGASAAQEPLTAGTLQSMEYAKQAMAVRVAAEAEALAAASEKREVEQLSWQDRRRDRRTVEKLKEKRLDTWREDMSRDEQKTIDDLAQNRRPNEESV